MGKALPFSSVDSYFKGLGESIPGCIVDTNFLIAATYENHPFFDDAEFLFGKLADYQIPVYSTVTTRAEFIDFRRRIIITEVLMDMMSSTSPWKLSKIAHQELKKHRTWIDLQASKEELPILTDARIKQCKSVFMPVTQSGKSGWVEICKHYLTGTMQASWNLVVEKLGTNHLDLNEAEAQKLILNKVEWKKMYEISEATCLGSSDAMLLNMLDCSVFPFVASADYDLAYSVLVHSPDKTILIPDSLYRNRIKGKRFS